MQNGGTKTDLFGDSVDNDDQPPQLVRMERVKVVTIDEPEPDSSVGVSSIKDILKEYIDEDNSQQVLLEQERFLPIANVSRLIKNMIPPTGKVSRDAKECIQECASEFICFVTSEACEKSLCDRRKTITGEDLIAALVNLGFDNFVDPLTEYLRKYRVANRPPQRHTDDEDANMEINGDSAEVAVEYVSCLPASSSASQQFIVQGTDSASTSGMISGSAVQNAQFFMDPTTGQHYIVTMGSDGTQQLLPFQYVDSADLVTDSSGIQAEQSSAEMNCIRRSQNSVKSREVKDKSCYVVPEHSEMQTSASSKSVHSQNHYAPQHGLPDSNSGAEMTPVSALPSKYVVFETGNYQEPLNRCSNLRKRRRQDQQFI